MDYAPVVVFERRKLIIRRLLKLGVPVLVIARAAEQPGTDGLDELWARERIIASLSRLNGCDRPWYERYSTAELLELERRTVSNLMGSDGRTPDQLIYSIGGRQPKHAASRRRQHLGAWGISA